MRRLGSSSTPWHSSDFPDTLICSVFAAGHRLVRSIGSRVRLYGALRFPSLASGNWTALRLERKKGEKRYAQLTDTLGFGDQPEITWQMMNYFIWTRLCPQTADCAKLVKLIGFDGNTIKV